MGQSSSPLLLPAAGVTRHADPCKSSFQSETTFRSATSLASTAESTNTLQVLLNPNP